MKIKTGAKNRFFGYKLLVLPILAVGVFGVFNLKTYAALGEDLTNYVRVKDLVMNPNDNDSLIITSVDKLFSDFNVGFVLEKQPTENSYFEFSTKGLPWSGFKNLQVKSQDGQTVIGEIKVVEEKAGARSRQGQKNISEHDFEALMPGDFWGAKMRVIFNKEVEKYQNISFQVNQKNASMGGWTLTDQDYTAPISLIVGNQVFAKDITVEKYPKTVVSRDIISHFRTSIYLQGGGVDNTNSGLVFKGDHVGKIVEVSMPEDSPVEFNGEILGQCAGGSSVTLTDNSKINSNHVVGYDPSKINWTCEIVSWDKNKVQFKVLTQAADDIISAIPNLKINISEEGRKKVVETGQLGKITYTYKILDGDREIYANTQQIDPVLIGNFEQFKTEQAKKIENQQIPSDLSKESDQSVRNTSDALTSDKDVKAPNTGFSNHQALPIAGIIGFIGVTVFTGLIRNKKKIKF